jgi:hypothetical protein
MSKGSSQNINAGHLLYNVDDGKKDIIRFKFLSLNAKSVHIHFALGGHRH